MLIEFALSSAPTHLHHPLGSKLHLIHPFPSEDCSVGSHCAEATLRINAQSVGRYDAETMVHSCIESNYIGAYATYSVIFGIPGVGVI